METTALNKQLAALRADDGVIKQRLAELDAKFAAWITAMRDGQQALLNRVRQPASPSSETEPETSTQALDEPPPKPESPKEPPVEPVAGDPQPVAEVKQPAPEEKVKSTPANRRPAPATEESEPHSPLFSGKSRRRIANSRDDTDAPADPKLTEEDRALLAKLDDETANAIRVKQRLTGHRKSVRELLSELSGAPRDIIEDEQERDHGKDKSGKRWWRRGQEQDQHKAR